MACCGPDDAEVGQLIIKPSEPSLLVKCGYSNSDLLWLVIFHCVAQMISHPCKKNSYIALHRNIIDSNLMSDRYRYIWTKRSVNIQYCQAHIAVIYHWLVWLIWINAGFIPADRWNDAQAYVVSHRFHHSLGSYFIWISELKRCRAVPIHCQMSVNIFYCWLSLPNVSPCHYSSVYRKTNSVC